MSKASKGMVRDAVRQICNMAPGEPKTEAIIMRYATALLGKGCVDLQAVRDALEWNLSESPALLRYIAADESASGEQEWLITAAGQAMERIR